MVHVSLEDTIFNLLLNFDRAYFLVVSREYLVDSVRVLELGLILRVSKVLWVLSFESLLLQLFYSLLFLFVIFCSF